jgi:hypothetical protein
MKILDFFYFCGSFLPSWIRIRNLNADPDPDQATQINADPCGSGSETLLPTYHVEVSFEYGVRNWIQNQIRKDLLSFGIEIDQNYQINMISCLSKRLLYLRRYVFDILFLTVGIFLC